MAGGRGLTPEPAEGLARTRGRVRCAWCAGDELYRAYHDEEWGRPVGDDRRLFELLSLELFQSGLSWRTILGKRDAFRRAFADFEPRRVARFPAARVGRLLEDASIVRHRGKIEAVVGNAARALELVRERGSLAAHVWSFEPGPEERPASATWPALRELSRTEASTRLSRDLRRRGWRFVGPTTAYSFMQAAGLVNDHVEGCWARRAVERERERFRRPRA